MPSGVEENKRPAGQWLPLPEVRYASGRVWMITEAGGSIPH